MSKPIRIPTDVSSKSLIKALRKRLQYVETRQTGSHVRLTRQGVDGQHHITIPAHNPIKVGTLRSILSDVAFYHRMSIGDLLGTLDL